MALARNCNWFMKVARTNLLSLKRHGKLDRRFFSVKCNEEELYISTKVQDLLKKITGFNLDKILKSRPISQPEPPKYKLLTEEQLQQQLEASSVKAQEYLQMPPYKKAWDLEASKNQILSEDPDIAMFEKDTSSYVFTDVSNGIHKRDRIVVVREKSGNLRMADLEEKYRLLAMYYPEAEKMFKMPQMFEEEHLEKLLGQQSYEYVLNRACLQFEPDDPNYVRVTQRTYEHILSNKQFDLLRSTRHFGPMAFYFVLYRKIDGLLLDMLRRDLLEDASCLVKLYCLAHPECQTNVELNESNVTDTFTILQTFMKNDSNEKMALEVTIDSLLRKNSPEENTMASG